MKALDAFIQEKPSGPLYHYTSAAGLIGIVKSRTLWATDHRHLNDRKEHRIGSTLIQTELDRSGLEKEHRYVFDRFVSEVEKGFFVLSFSERGDQLSQWRAYCPDGNGYSLGFAQNNALFDSAQQNSFNLIRCVYNQEEQETLCKYLVDGFIEVMAFEKDVVAEKNVESKLRAFFQAYQWRLALALITSALKHNGFEEEKEWRLVSQHPDDLLRKIAFRPGRFGITPYFELPICTKDSSIKFDEIIIGPTSNRAVSLAALDIFLSKNDLRVGKKSVSQTPLRQ
jgi:hypothetical protein